MDEAIKPGEILSTALSEQRARSERAIWPEFLLALAATSILVGIIWDISWHISVGRDTFWTAAHMAIYFGGASGGLVGGWLAIKHTFLAGPAERAASVKVLGARAPLGAWVAIWGAVAMLTSAPFDDWWHNAYGLDVKIISPPHALLGLGMLGISLGALLLAASRQNQEPDGPGGWLFVYVGGIFLALGAVFISEFTYPNLQHAAIFYKVSAAMLAFRLVSMGRAGRVSWPATRVALVYMGIECLMIWILPLFPARPKLAPIFNPITHMVPPVFPLLLIFPALGIDLVLRWVGEWKEAWRRVMSAFALGAVFLAVFILVQWFFAEFLLSPHASNWFFAGDRFWGYGAGPGEWRTQFWRDGGDNGPADPVGFLAVIESWLLASVSAWLGLLWGSWMRKVKR